MALGIVTFLGSFATHVGYAAGLSINNVLGERVDNCDSSVRLSNGMGNGWSR